MKRAIAKYMQWHYKKISVKLLTAVAARSTGCSGVPPPCQRPPPINFIRDITAVDKNHLKNQQSQLDGKI